MYRGVAGVVFLTGCFNPHYDSPTCGPGGACPTDLTCNGQNVCVARLADDAGTDDTMAVDSSTDSSIDSGPVDAAFAPLCAGQPQLRLCVTFDGTFTDEASSLNVTPTGSTFVAGAVDQAAEVHTNDSILVEPSPQLNFTNVFTFEAFVRIDGSTTTSFIVDKPSEWAMFVDPTERLACRVKGSTTMVQTPITVGAWTHVGCTFDGSMIRIYVDGVLTQTFSAPGSIGTSSREVGLGGQATSPTTPLQGAIDEVRIWGMARTASDMQAAAARRQ